MRVSMWLVESLSRLSCLFLTCTRLESSNASDYTNSSSLPLVCWHGVNDDAQSCDQVFQTLPNDTYTLSIQIGDSLEADKYNSVFLGMMEQVSRGCEIISSDPLLEDGYNAVGLSQGGLLLRAVAQLCPEPSMKTLVTLGSPQQGIFGLPKCKDDDVFDECTVVRDFLSQGAYIQWIQAPAQYWHDPLQNAKFQEVSEFLAFINNDRSSQERNATIKDNLTKLENFIMIQWRNDTFVIPKESSHFGFYPLNNTDIVNNLEDTTLFQEDWVGMKILSEEDKLHFFYMNGDHMDFDKDWFHENIVHFLS